MRVKRLARWGIPILLTIAPAAVLSQDRTSDPLVPSATPYLVSISVADLDETVNWYRENLGFVLIKQMEFPKYSLRIAFVELNGFRLELIEFKASVSYEAIQKQFPVVDDRAKIHGLGKLAFLVEDLEAVSNRLKRNNVKFWREIMEDQEFGVRSLIVSDNSGNWIQFFQKMK